MRLRYHLNGVGEEKEIPNQKKIRAHSAILYTPALKVVTGKEKSQGV